MGCLPLFCCFKNMRPNTISSTAIITNLIALAFLIWGISDIQWDWFKKSRKHLYLFFYIISFLFLCLTFIFLILIIVFLNLRIGPNFMTLNKVGKILCLIIIGLCILAFILLLIAEILILIDYNDFENELGPGRNIPSHDWAAVILPGILGLIASVIVTLCVNVLYKIFNDNILTSFDIYQNNSPININQNSMTTIDKVQNQNPVAVVSGNNSEIIPPINPYNQPLPAYNSDVKIKYNNE